MSSMLYKKSHMTNTIGKKIGGEFHNYKEEFSIALLS